MKSSGSRRERKKEIGHVTQGQNKTSGKKETEG